MLLAIKFRAVHLSPIPKEGLIRELSFLLSHLEVLC